jgi:hypothetical protein
MDDKIWKLTLKRNEIIDKIVKRANTREGQHMLEITQEIRQLREELESLKI